MMVRFQAGGKAWSSAPDAGELCGGGQGMGFIVRPPRWNHPCLIGMPRCSLYFAKRVQTESRTTSPCLIVMPRCSLSYAKIGK